MKAKKFKVNNFVKICIPKDYPYKKWDVVITGTNSGIVVDLKDNKNYYDTCTLYTLPLKSKLDFYLLIVKVFFMKLINKI